MSEEVQDQTPQKPLDVSEAVAQTIDFMSALAWQKLGLQPDMMTGQIEQDMAQAKIAIDAVTKLVEIIEPSLEDEEDKRRVQNLVRDLRINYVEKSGESS